MEPFLRWAGGKRWLAKSHPEWFQCGLGTYIEPFLGGGAVFFQTLPRTSLLSDLNGDLINTYQAVKTRPDVVLQLLRGHEKRHSPAYYYRLRRAASSSSVASAARFIYLNRACFNGLYRVNQRGQFNVPIGSHKSILLESDDFESVSRALRGSKLVNQDFEKSIKQAQPGDLVYADPPYTVKHNQNSFVDYNERIFSWADQERLAEALHDASARDVRVVLSNADHPSIHDLYRQKGWVRLTVERFSGIGSRAAYRRTTTEVVLSNFLTKSGALRSRQT